MPKYSKNMKYYKNGQTSILKMKILVCDSFTLTSGYLCLKHQQPTYQEVTDLTPVLEICSFFLTSSHESFLNGQV